LNAEPMSLGELLRMKLNQMEPQAPAPDLMNVDYSGLEQRIFSQGLCPEVVVEDWEQDFIPKHRSTYIGTTPYSALMLKPQDFRNLIARLCQELPSFMHSCGAQAVAVRGTSGYSVAFAMRMVCDIPFIIARKSGESSHGTSISMFEDGNSKEISRYIILDDLVSSGKTVMKMTEDLAPAKCMAVVEYIKLMNGVVDGWTDGLRMEKSSTTSDYDGDAIPLYRHKSR